MKTNDYTKTDYTRLFPLRRVVLCSIPQHCWDDVTLTLECGHILQGMKRSEVCPRKRCKQCFGVRGQFVSKEEMIQRLTDAWMADIQEQLRLNVNSYYWRRTDAELLDGLHNMYRPIFQDGQVIGFDQHDSYGQGYRGCEVKRKLRWDNLGFDGVGVEV